MLNCLVRIDERRARYPEAVAKAARSVAIMRTVLAEAAGRGAEALPRQADTSGGTLNVSAYPRRLPSDDSPLVLDAP